MKMCWTACIAAALQVTATAALADTPATAPAPKVINKDTAVSGEAKAAPAIATPAIATPATAPPAVAAPVVAAPVVTAPATSAGAASTAVAGDKTANPAKETAAKDAAKDADGEKTVAKTVAPPPKPKPAIVISVDLSRQRMSVAEDGVEKHQWPISSGRSGYATPTGNYRPQWMAKMWRSRKYDDAPMPNSIFFTGGFAIHATFATGMLGRPASHGCVRLAPANAATLFKMVQARGMDRTRISVFGSPRFSEPAVARRDDGRARYASAEQPMRSYGAARTAQGASGAPRYMAPPQKQNIFVSIFGSNQPQPVVYARQRQQMPLRAARTQQAQQRPLYAYTQDGRLVRIR